MEVASWQGPYGMHSARVRKVAAVAGVIARCSREASSWRFIT